MLHILVVTNTFPTPSKPGATPCIKDQVEAMKRQCNVDIEVLHIDGPTNKLNYLKGALKLFLLNVRKSRYELVHAHYGYSGFLALLQFRHPVVVTFHGSDILDRVEGKVGRFVARFACAVITMSDQMKDVSRRTDAYVIPFGVDTRIFRPFPQHEARTILGLPRDKKLILFPYNPKRREKRIDIVKEVVKQLKSMGELAELVIVYNRPREVLCQFMNACDLMVLASDHEGSPVAVREAVACDLPVVSVDVGDVRDVIDGLEACYITERTSQALAEKVKSVLVQGARSNGSQTVKSVDVELSAQKVYKVYEAILAHRESIKSNSKNR